MVNWNENDGFQKMPKWWRAMGKGRVESGVVKEDFWDEVEFDTRVCITGVWGRGNEIFSML